MKNEQEDNQKIKIKKSYRKRIILKVKWSSERKKLN